MFRARDRVNLAASLNIGMATIAIVLAWFLLKPFGVAGGGAAWLIAQSLGAALVGILAIKRN